jgi:hypothetical protein
MRKLSVCLLLAPLALGGCIALSDSPPPKQTVVVPAPATTTVVCANGTSPPCY